AVAARGAKLRLGRARTSQSTSRQAITAPASAISSHDEARAAVARPGRARGAHARAGVGGVGFGCVLEADAERRQELAVLPQVVEPGPVEVLDHDDWSRRDLALRFWPLEHERLGDAWRDRRTERELPAQRDACRGRTGQLAAPCFDEVREQNRPIG